MQATIQLTSGVHPRYVAHCSNDADCLVITSNPDDAMLFSSDFARYLLEQLEPMWPLAQLSHAVSEEA
ncbi:hypothetical protein [Vibrio sp. 11986-1-5]|uniref:hypothetical protein n=1 Tax=Vibrio sp. 11986-1-5 TaxID=2211215 RepID=UPI000D729849|nr:hypothetical protein [Vibrio sp. 11986-1-5]PXA73726.1 hypothetical protein DMC15_06650 [Vibrio sp. 11986-1-5]